MKKIITKELVWSALMAGGGLAWLYSAAFGADRNVVWSVFLKLGCALTVFECATQPGMLFEKVKRKGFFIARGEGSFLGVASTVCWIVALLAWLASP